MGLVPLATPVWLDPGVVACLKKKCKTVAYAVWDAYDGGALDGLGTEIAMGTVPGAATVLILPRKHREAWERVVAFHQCERPEVAGTIAGAAPKTAAAREGQGRRDGKKRKQHPGIALQEAALLIKEDETVGDVEIAAAATKKALDLPELTGAEIADHDWGDGMHRKQVPFLRQAIKDGLVKAKGGELFMRSRRTGPWRRLGLLEWAEIPRLEQPVA
jgi:hypothetical protein